MANFHLTVKSVSRGKGQSAIAKAAYNARQELRDERTGETKDYMRRSDAVSFSGIFAPQNAPKWVHDRAALWNAVEQSEKRKDARLATEIEIALPHELTDDQRKQLVTDFAREQFARRGIIADVNIHRPPREPRPGAQPNHHAHILLTLREVDGDRFGKRLPECDPQEIHRLRGAWEKIANRYLERYGHEARIDRRTLKEQGIGREPTRHRGPQVDAMQRRGIDTDRAASVAPAPRPLSKAAGEIRMAYTLSDSAPAFVAALREEDMLLARVTLNDLLENEQAREAAAELGKIPPAKLRNGEVVVVNKFGGVVRLDERTTGDKAAEINKYLAGVPSCEFQSSVADAQAEQMRARALKPSPELEGKDLVELRALRAEVRDSRYALQQELKNEELLPSRRAFLQEKAAELRDLHTNIRREITALEIGAERELPPARTVSEEGPAIGKTAGRAAGQAFDVVEKTLGAAIEKLGDFIAPTAPTREQILARREDREQAAAAAVAEATKQAKEPDQPRAPEIIDRLKYTSDPAYRRQVDAADRRLREEAESQQRTDEKDRGRSRER